MCDHKRVMCMDCGLVGSPASLIGRGKKKTLSPAALAARKANASKPRGPRRKSAAFSLIHPVQCPSCGGDFPANEASYVDFGACPLCGFSDKA